MSESWKINISAATVHRYSDQLWRHDRFAHYNVKAMNAKIRSSGGFEEETARREAALQSRVSQSRELGVVDSWLEVVRLLNMKHENEREVGACA